MHKCPECEALVEREPHPTQDSYACPSCEQEIDGPEWVLAGEDEYR